MRRGKIGYGSSGVQKEDVYAGLLLGQRLFPSVLIDPIGLSDQTFDPISVDGFLKRSRRSSYAKLYAGGIAKLIKGSPLLDGCAFAGLKKRLDRFTTF